MAETLGMLCDKLTIVKLKQYHSVDQDRLDSLAVQSEQLQEEIDLYIGDVITGKIPPSKLSFVSNKVFKPEGNETAEILGSIGEVFNQLAETNCNLWHVQEKVYEFHTVPAEEKDLVVKKLALLNLERTKCIDTINSVFESLVLAQNKG